MRSAIAVAPRDFYSNIKSGKIFAHKSEISEFTKRAVKLANGDVIEADVIVSCTGFQVDLSILPPQFQNLVEKDGLHLYKHVLHPGKNI
jgi:dimethylaniline monooxygenase (N-oxide forming)